MAGDTFLDLTSGYRVQRRASQTSAGVANAGDVVGLGDDGYLDPTLFPAGIGPDIKLIQASETLAAGDFVNIHNVAGAWRVRKADASTNGKQAHGYVKAVVTSGNNASVYFEGLNTQVTGMLPGDVWLSTTPGQATQTPPSGTGQIIQILGVATAATEIDVEIEEKQLLA